MRGTISALTASTVRKALEDSNVEHLHLSTFQICKTIKAVLFLTESNDFSRFISLIKMRTMYVGEHFIEKYENRVAILFTCRNQVSHVFSTDNVCKKSIDAMMINAFYYTPFEVSTFQIKNEQREITLRLRMIFTKKKTAYPPDSMFAIQPYIAACFKALSNLKITRFSEVKKTAHGDLIEVNYDFI